MCETELLVFDGCRYRYLYNIDLIIEPQTHDFDLLELICTRHIVVCHVHMVLKSLLYRHKMQIKVTYNKL